jgi:hypothetical protein
MRAACVSRNDDKTRPEKKRTRNSALKPTPHHWYSGVPPAAPFYQKATKSRLQSTGPAATCNLAAKGENSMN